MKVVLLRVASPMERSATTSVFLIYGESSTAKVDLKMKKIKSEIVRCSYKRNGLVSLSSNVDHG